LEYKAKQGLNSGKDLTVIPPAEYQERFIRAMESYFLVSPGEYNAAAARLSPHANFRLLFLFADKWSKPLTRSSAELSDVCDLPSVL
jgi:hypothetical protein